MQASKESIEKLIENASLTVCDVYKALKRDIKLLHACKGTVSPLLELVPEMRMNVLFILIDLETETRALFSAKSAIEKRLHLINIQADMQECYKLLYGFGNGKKYTTWSKIGNQLRTLTKESADELYSSLLVLFDTVSSNFETTGAYFQNKEKRDLAYHYDDDLLKVYQNLLEANDEEEALKHLILMHNSTHNVLQFCDYIEVVELLKGNKLPSVEEQNGTFLANQKLFAEQLRAHEEFQKTINRILNSATQIDAEARKKQGMARIKEFAKEKQIDFPEADNMDIMANTLLLLRIMLVDIASTVNAYIHSGSEPEYAFNRRRLTITRFSTLEKLFGYVEDYRDSRLWAYIVKMIPQEDERLKMEAVSIEESLKTRIDAEDKEARVLFVHPLDKG